MSTKTVNYGADWSLEEAAVAVYLYRVAGCQRVGISSSDPTLIAYAAALGRTPGALSWKIGNIAGAAGDARGAKVSPCDIRFWARLGNLSIMELRTYLPSVEGTRTQVADKRDSLCEWIQLALGDLGEAMMKENPYADIGRASDKLYKALRGEVA